MTENTSTLVAIFTKGKNFSDLLFASVKDNWRLF